MNIFVDPEAFTVYTTGIKIYAEKLISALASEYPNSRFFSRSETINPAIFFHFAKKVKQKTGVDIDFTGRLIPSFLQFPHDFTRNKHSDRYDVIHIMTNKIPRGCSFIDPEKLVLTIHDVFYFYDKYISSANEAMQKLQSKAAHAAKMIITVSDFSKKEIMKHLNIDPDKIFVTPIAIQWNREQLVKHSAATGKKDFFLAVGAIKINKNYATLLQAFRHYRKQNKTGKLVIVGCCQDKEILREILNTEGVKYFSEVSPQKLIELYQTAKGFFALSTLEGFGIPLLEAMTCGCPACYARGNSMDEIGRSAAFSIEDPYDWKSASEIMERFSDGGSEVITSVSECRKIAEEYSWERCAKQTYHVYELVNGEN